MKDNTMKITTITTLLDAICIGVAYYFATELKFSTWHTVFFAITVGLFMILPLIELVCYFFERKEK